MQTQAFYPLGAQGSSGGSFMVTITPPSVFAYSPIRGAGVISAPVTAVASGGTPPYSYAWTIHGGISAGSPTSATTTFGHPSQSVSYDVEATARCTVTDATTATAFASCDVECASGAIP